MAHPIARLTPRGGLFLADCVSAGWTIAAAARAVVVSRQTGPRRSWRFRLEGPLGLIDRRSIVRPTRPAPIRLRSWRSCAFAQLICVSVRTCSAGEAPAAHYKVSCGVR